MANGANHSAASVLVTGATGFVGRALVAQLLQQHVRLRLLVRNIDHARQWSDSKVEAVVGDLTQAHSLGGICDGVTTVFHLASHASLRAAHEADPNAGHRPVSEIGTQALVEHALRAGVQKFVFASSIKVFGESGCNGPDELTPARPNSDYGRAKRSAEQTVLNATEMNPTILRLAPLYGVGNDSIIARLIAALDRGWLPRLPECGNRRSLVHVDDVVRALLVSAEHLDAAGKIYHLTDGMSYSIDTLLRLIADAVGRPLPMWTAPKLLLNAAASAGTLLGRILDRQLPFNHDVLEKLLGSAWVRDGRIRADLGFATRHTLQSALPEIIANYRASCRK